MTIDSKAASLLRRWADFFDPPPTKPAEEPAVHYNIDARGSNPAVTEQAVMRAMAQVKAKAASPKKPAPKKKKAGK